MPFLYRYNGNFYLAVTLKLIKDRSAAFDKKIERERGYSKMGGTSPNPYLNLLSMIEPQIKSLVNQYFDVNQDLMLSLLRQQPLYIESFSGYINDKDKLRPLTTDTNQLIPLVQSYVKCILSVSTALNERSKENGEAKHIEELLLFLTSAVSELSKMEARADISENAHKLVNFIQYKIEVLNTTNSPSLFLKSDLAAILYKPTEELRKNIALSISEKTLEYKSLGTH